jgi:hypothetical protein
MKVFSFCLYGPYNERYYPGMLQNLQLINKHFPDWYTFIYIGADVDAHTVSVFQTAPKVIIRYTGQVGAINMIHRFFAIDEPGVEVMMVRDADSRVHWKDRWAIRQFDRSTGFVAHAIRDNNQHTAPLMGGLWGLRKTSGINVREEYAIFKANPLELGFAHDQDFLSVRIHPKVLGRVLAHIGGGAPQAAGETAREFPFPWINDVYCGRVESSNFQDSDEPSVSKPFRMPPMKLSR